MCMGDKLIILTRYEDDCLVCTHILYIIRRINLTHIKICLFFHR
jgi:hypothetical protein